MESLIEFFKTYFSKIKSPWKEILSVLCGGVVGLLIALAGTALPTSCGTTRAVIRTSADNTNSSISITTNNPTNVSVTNGVDSLGFRFSPNK